MRSKGKISELIQDLQSCDGKNWLKNTLTSLLHYLFCNCMFVGDMQELEVWIFMYCWINLGSIHVISPVFTTVLLQNIEYTRCNLKPSQKVEAGMGKTCV